MLRIISNDFYGRATKQWLCDKFKKNKLTIVCETNGMDFLPPADSWWKGTRYIICIVFVSYSLSPEKNVKWPYLWFFWQGHKAMIMTFRLNPFLLSLSLSIIASHRDVYCFSESFVLLWGEHSMVPYCDYSANFGPKT